jgi:Mor family transcriptional regulator
VKYISAENILPKELIETIQKYCQGQYVYIPKEDGIRSKWGTKSGAKKELEIRNKEIKFKFECGQSKESLAEDYCLSVSSIKKIVYETST